MFASPHYSANPYYQYIALTSKLKVLDQWLDYRHKFAQTIPQDVFEVLLESDKQGCPANREILQIPAALLHNPQEGHR
jgi:hypothetical protein